MDNHFVVVTPIEAEGLRQLLESELMPPGDCLAAMPGERLTLGSEREWESLSAALRIDPLRPVIHVRHAELPTIITALESIEISADRSATGADLLRLHRTALTTESDIVVALF